MASLLLDGEKAEVSDGDGGLQSTVEPDAPYEVCKVK